MVSLTSVTPLEHVAFDGRALVVNWSEHSHQTFHPLSLREACGCRECIHPFSGQRTLDVSSLPPDLAPQWAGVEEGALQIVWNDGHVSEYSREELDHIHSYTSSRTVRIPWDSETGGPVTPFEYEDVVGKQDIAAAWLAAVARNGFALLRGVPTIDGEVTRVAELFGYVRETNHGRYFDVRSVVYPTNLAYTGPALAVHTDNPYRDPVPTLQLLHCLSSTLEGGDSILVDGLTVAELLRVRDPEAFQTLINVPVRFRYQDDKTDLERETALITLDPCGEITGIYFNARSLQPVSLPFETVEQFFNAYRRFANLLFSPEFEIRLKLEPGDLLIVDNTRVLRGRTGFDTGGERHLQGCYADRDGLLSRLAVLERAN